jgi:hypothetical protein
VSQRGRRTGTRLTEFESRAPRAGAEAAPTILVVGVVRHVEWLLTLGRVERARWSVLAPRAARSAADLVVVGRPTSGADAVALIARLKDEPATAATPVLHADAAELGCAGCRADACLSTGSVPGQLTRVAGALLELARARARSSGLCVARASLAGCEASRPAP